MEEKKYRPNVAAVILSPSYPFTCDIFLGQRSDIEHVWQFPQGGIDDNETPKQALFRELKEEIGTDDIEVICEHPNWLSYDFPNHISRFPEYVGQIQKYFLVRLKNSARIKIQTQHPEFSSYKFVKLGNLIKYINHFKKDTYLEVLKYFKQEGYL